ncbi:choice-of-anchor I family protein [Corynebacterium guangdongense]|uniref:Choice-of-anchor I domain-containing protein n=1 Tax=Corynebacterium guangdongense TaxID=1783348 RepID=A0ABU1ZZA3_9CORY|nr:choice-of-anchor I family protein [Corynebacterium guangdongense]MDR7329713.1 hypothetical protein [Corynebacterium guangdongense]
MTIRRSATAIAAAAATSLAILAVPATAAIVDEPSSHVGSGALTLEAVGSYDSGVFDASAAEIVSFHPESASILTVNAHSGQVDVIDASDVTDLTLKSSVEVAGHVINSVAVRADGLVIATAEPADDKTAPGKVVFFDANDPEGGILHEVTVGSLPDMVTFNEDGTYALVANEGEPAEDYSVDPEGSVSVITVPANIERITEATGRTAGFEAWNGVSREELFADDNIRVYGPEGSNAQNFEPEYITVDGDTAYVALQENNAVAVVDVPTATVTDIWGLGTIDRGIHPFDPSDRDGEFNPRTYEGVKAFPLPDAIDSYTVGGVTYIVTANEGDARDWEGYSEELRFKDVGDPEETDIVLSESIDAALQDDAELGRMNITTANGVTDGVLEEIYTYGGRGFSIYNAESGELVYYSGDDFEKHTHAANPEFFNSNHSESNFEGRSDDKGPEPESVVLAELNGRTYAFIANERVGGVMVYDVTDPAAPVYSSYLNNRDFSVDMESFLDEEGNLTAEGQAALPTAGDLGPEGQHYIAPQDSPNGRPLLVVGNEVSGTTTVFEIKGTDADLEALSARSSSTGAADLGSSTGAATGALALVIGLIAAVGGVVATTPGLLNLLPADVRGQLEARLR